MKNLKQTIRFTLLYLLLTARVLAAPPPTRINDCSNTFIQEITTRFDDDPDAEAVVVLTNGVVLFFYVKIDEVPALKTALPGDKVKLCLTQVPDDCPPGDERGKIYSVLNYRTQQYFKAMNSWHYCGGA